jgi:hypothetical protein
MRACEFTDPAAHGRLAPMTNPAAPFTILDGDRALELSATRDGERVLLDAAAVRDRLGWELKPEGLCREDVCIPVRDRGALVAGGRIDLAALARLLDRPLALDAANRCAALGTGHAARAASLATLEAPDFELPDLHGRMHALSAHRGKKVLLIAYASW